MDKLKFKYSLDKINKIANNNKIKIIPDNISNLINLKYFYINNNEIKILSKKFKNLINLKYFSFNSELLSLIPVELKNN
jgi:Leucine-rich repeat (LRR) protein